MSNASVIERMRELIKHYQNNGCSAGEFENAIEFHMDALEFIDLDTVHRARELAWELVNAHLLDGDIEFGDPVDADKARNEFYQFLDELPVGPS